MRDALREALTTALAVVLHEHRDPGCTGEPDYEDTQTEALYLIEDIYRQPNVRAALAARSEPDDIACNCANGDGTTHPKYHTASCPIALAARSKGGTMREALHEGLVALYGDCHHDRGEASDGRRHDGLR